MKLLHSAFIIGSAHAAGNLYQMFDDCDVNDITTTLWDTTTSVASGYEPARAQFQCLDNPPLLFGRDQTEEDDRTIFKSCVLTCKTGYSMNSGNRTSVFDASGQTQADYDAKVVRKGTYSCRRIHDNWQYYYWRYNDHRSSDNTVKNLETHSDFQGCESSNCFTPVLLSRRGQTTRKPTRQKGWSFAWEDPVSGATLGSTNSYLKDRTTHKAKEQQTGRLYIYKPAIKNLMGGYADFANNGYTLIVTLAKEMKGKFFVTNGANLHAHRDSNDDTKPGWGKTFSFTSREHNRAHIVDFDQTKWDANQTAAETDRDNETDKSNWNQQTATNTAGNSVNYYANMPNYENYITIDNIRDYRLTFQMTFIADPGETLPDDQKIVKVEILEFEFAHTECRTDSATFDSYGQYYYPGSLPGNDPVLKKVKMDEILGNTADLSTWSDMEDSGNSYDFKASGFSDNLAC